MTPEADLLVNDQSIGIDQEQRENLSDAVLLYGHLVVIEEHLKRGGLVFEVGNDYLGALGIRGKEDDLQTLSGEIPVQLFENGQLLLTALAGGSEKIQNQPAFSQTVFGSSSAF